MQKKKPLRVRINTFYGSFNHIDVKENRAASELGVTGRLYTRLFTKQGKAVLK